MYTQIIRSIVAANQSLPATIFRVLFQTCVEPFKLRPLAGLTVEHCKKPTGTGEKKRQFVLFTFIIIKNRE